MQKSREDSTTYKAKNVGIITPFRTGRIQPCINKSSESLWCTDAAWRLPRRNATSPASLDFSAPWGASVCAPRGGPARNLSKEKIVENPCRHFCRYASNGHIFCFVCPKLKSKFVERGQHLKSNGLKPRLAQCADLVWSSWIALAMLQKISQLLVKLIRWKLQAFLGRHLTVLVYHRPLLGHLVGVAPKLLSRWYRPQKSTMTCSCPWAGGPLGLWKTKLFLSNLPIGLPRWILLRGVEHPAAPSKKKHPPSTCNPSSIVDLFQESLTIPSSGGEKKHVSVHRSSSTNVIEVSIRHAGCWKKILHRLRLWRMWSFYRRFMCNGWSRTVTPDHMTPVRSHVQQGDQAL